MKNTMQRYGLLASAQADEGKKVLNNRLFLCIEGVK